MAATYRKIRRIMMIAAIFGLLVITANAGLLAGLALIVAFVIGMACTALNYLEDEADKADKAF